jgi:ketosteroid isomerase-like protein
MESADEHQILALFEDGDRALMSADIDELSRIFADDYVQYNESGRAFTKHDVLENLKSGKIRYISMISSGRQVRLFEDFAIVHGSEEDEVEQGGKRFSVRYVYTDVVIKRNGTWQIVGSQLARPA